MPEGREWFEVILHDAVRAKIEDNSAIAILSWNETMMKDYACACGGTSIRRKRPISTFVSSPLTASWVRKGNEEDSVPGDLSVLVNGAP